MDRELQRRVRAAIERFALWQRDNNRTMPLGAERSPDQARLDHKARMAAISTQLELAKVTRLLDTPLLR